MFVSLLAARRCVGVVIFNEVVNALLFNRNRCLAGLRLRLQTIDFSFVRFRFGFSSSGRLRFVFSGKVLEIICEKRDGISRTEVCNLS